MNRKNFVILQNICHCLAPMENWHSQKALVYNPLIVCQKASQQAKIFKERVMKYQKNFTSNLELPEDQLDDFTLPQEKVNVSSEQRVFTDVHKDIFPCGMLMCGSAALMVQVNMCNFHHQQIIFLGVFICCFLYLSVCLCS